MSLKDEIEKIIQSERQKLDARDRKAVEYSEQKCQNFNLMRVLLTELAESVEPNYLRVRIHEAGAILELGRDNNRGHFSSDTRWLIEPNFKLSSEAGWSFVSEPGIRVEETQYYRNLPEPEISEQTHIFANERKAMEYFVTKVAQKIALYRHLATQPRDKTAVSSQRPSAS